MIEIVPDIDKRFILDKLSQEEIFERYLGIEVSYTEKVCSPLRNDATPTCTFKRYGNTVIFKDWAGHFYGDCFTLVQYQYGCNFYEACKIIARDFSLIEADGKVSNVKRKPKVYEYKEEENSKVIQVKWRSYIQSDIDYWESYGINHKTLKYFNVAPIRFAWINNDLRYVYKVGDPCYAYYFEEGVHKLYFPEREEYRFLGNHKGLQGYNQLPEKGKLLVITKSLKDVMFLHQLGIAAVAPPSESSIITEQQYIELSKRFDTIVSLYDFDLTGVRSANRMYREYSIKRIFLTNGRFGSIDYGGKDITDVAKKYGKERAEEVLKEIL